MIEGEKEGRTRGGDNLRYWDDQVGVRTENESKETDILIERTIMGLARNLVLEEFSGSHKYNPS